MAVYASKLATYVLPYKVQVCGCCDCQHRQNCTNSMRIITTTEKGSAYTVQCTLPSTETTCFFLWKLKPWWHCTNECKWVHVSSVSNKTFTNLWLSGLWLLLMFGYSLACSSCSLSDFVQLLFVVCHGSCASPFMFVWIFASNHCLSLLWSSNAWSKSLGPCYLQEQWMALDFSSLVF